MIDRRELEKVIADFHRAFPDAKIIRHAHSHLADLFGTPAKAAKNSVDGGYDAHGINIGPNASGTVVSGISKRRVLATILGQIVGYELSQQSLDQIDRSRLAMERVFAAAGRQSMMKFKDMLEAGDIDGP